MLVCLFPPFLMKNLPLFGLLACRFANALINANAKRIGYVYSSRECQTDQRCLCTYFHYFLSETLPVLGLLACCFANALINANARQIYRIRSSRKCQTAVRVYLRPMLAHIRLVWANIIEVAHTEYMLSTT